MPSPNLKVEDLVLLKKFTLLTNQWSRARVHKVIFDKDNRVRCIEVRKPDGSILLRDVNSICKLERDLE